MVVLAAVEVTEEVLVAEAVLEEVPVAEVASEAVLAVEAHMVEVVFPAEEEDKNVIVTYYPILQNEWDYFRTFANAIET